MRCDTCKERFVCYTSRWNGWYLIRGDSNGMKVICGNGTKDDYAHKDGSFVFETKARARNDCADLQLYYPQYTYSIKYAWCIQYLLDLGYKKCIIGEQRR